MSTLPSRTRSFQNATGACTWFNISRIIPDIAVKPTCTHPVDSNFCRIILGLPACVCGVIDHPGERACRIPGGVQQRWIHPHGGQGWHRQEPPATGTCGISDLETMCPSLCLQVNERITFLVESSEGGCILVEGEAGMGKSRLLEEVQRSDLDGKAESVTVVRAAASTAYRSQVKGPLL